MTQYSRTFFFIVATVSQVYVDQKSVRSGPLEDEFDFLKPKEIDDPDQSKPEDWVDEKRIPDPEEKKPAGYDDISPEIPDPEVGGAGGRLGWGGMGS